MCRMTDGVPYRTGKVQNVFTMDTSLYPSVIVQWKGLAQLDSYNLGQNGKVDIKYIKEPTSGGKVYWYHLPCPWELSPGRTTQVLKQNIAKQPGELNLTPGETVTNVVELDPLCLVGVLKGVQGKFPAECIQGTYNVPFDHENSQKYSASSEELSSGGSFTPAPPPLRSQTSSPSGESLDTLSGMSHSDREHSSADSASVNIQRLETGEDDYFEIEATGDDRQNKQDKIQGLAMYDYVADKDGDLSFKLGDVISDIISSGDNWLMGNVKGQAGYFPRNYVKILNGDHDAISYVSEDYLTPTNNPQEKNDTPEDHLVTYVNVGDVINKRDVRDVPTVTVETSKLKRRKDGDGLSEYANIGGAFTKRDRDGTRPMTGVPSFKARCRHTYKARAEGDLSMKEDDIIHDVIAMDDEYWTGVLHGVSGRFPARYVQKLPDGTSSSRERTDLTVISEVTYL